MAYSVLQATSTKSSPTGATKVPSIAFVSPCAVGSLLVFASDHGNGETITGLSGGGTWALGGAQTDATNGQIGEWWYAVATGGATTITITTSPAGGVDAAAVAIAEFSGTATSSPLDTSDSTKAYAATSLTANAETSNSITPAASGELLVAFMQDSASAPAITAGTGWTLAIAEPGIASNDGAVAIEWKTGGSGAQSATYTVDKVGDRYTVQIAAFKAAPSGTIPIMAMAPYIPTSGN